MMETLCYEKTQLSPSSEKSSQTAIDDDWHVEAILGPEYLAPVRTVDAFVDLIVDKRQTSRLVQDLQRFSPIPSLRHLKRVNPDGRIIISLADGASKNGNLNTQLSISKNEHLPNSCLDSLQLCERDVSSKKRSFCEASGDFTTMCQVPSTTDEKICSINDKHHASSIEKLQKVAEDKTNSPTCCPQLPEGLNPEGLRGKPERVAVPATPPLTRKQFLEAQRVWACNFHPSHAVEAALSPGAGLGAAEREPLLTAMKLCAQRCSGEGDGAAAAAAVRPSDGRVVALALDARDAHPLQHAAMRLVDLVARAQGGGVWHIRPGEEIAQSNTDGNAKGGSLPYLCTGLDIVMTREPCAMCAMALTHARARRVFFSEDNADHGVVYSHTPPLHTLPGLNHRFSVFRAPLPKSMRI